MPYFIDCLCVMSKNATNSTVCFQGLNLSDVLFNVSVILWSAFAGSQTGAWVLDYFRLLGRASLRGVFEDFRYNGEETYWSTGC
jgi:hypothetical protein